MTEDPFLPAPDEWALDALGPRRDDNPAFCGWRWWANLLHRDSQLEHLVAQTVPGREEYWGDYSEAAAYLEGWDLATGVEDTSRADVKQMRFIQAGGATSLYVRDDVMVEMRRLTLLRCADGAWRAWSVGPLEPGELPPETMEQAPAEPDESQITGPRVELRPESVLPDDTLLLLRLFVADVNMVIKKSLNDWTLYKGVLASLGRSGDGALAISMFALRDGWNIERLSTISNHTHFQSVEYGVLRKAQVEVWPTNTWDAVGRPAPTNEVHYDMIIPEVPGVIPERVQAGTPAERRAARAALLPSFERVLTLLSDPHPFQ